MSRRLTISSLLCDDDPQPISDPVDKVVLAEHLIRGKKSPPRVETVSSSPLSSRPSIGLGLDALVHVAVEERSRLQQPQSTEYAPYNYHSRHQQQLEQRHVHREQILGYNDRTTPGIPLTNILTSDISPTSFADEHSHNRKRRYSETTGQHFPPLPLLQQQQQDDTDRYRPPPPVPLRRAGAGYDPVHDSQSPWSSAASYHPEEGLDERKRARSTHYLSPSRDERPQYTYPASRSPHFQHDAVGERYPNPRNSYTAPSPTSSPYPSPSYPHTHNTSHPQASHAHPHLPERPPSANQHQHRVVTPPIGYGRRSPPGSQAGRAIAAKKVEQEQQFQMSNMEGAFPTRPTEREMASSGTSADGGKDIKKKERKSSRTTKESSPHPVVKPDIPASSPIPPLPSTATSSRHTTATHLSPSHPTHPRALSSHSHPHMHARSREDDPHEWFLEHYADANDSVSKSGGDDVDRQKIKRPHSSASSASGVVVMQSPAATAKSDHHPHSGRRASQTASPVYPAATTVLNRKSSSASSSPATTTKTKPKTNPYPVVTPSKEDTKDKDVGEVDGDDAMMALEQELDAELANVGVGASNPDMYESDTMDVDADVDQAVAELVDQTLGSDNATPAHTKVEDADVDVDMLRAAGVETDGLDEQERTPVDLHNNNRAQEVAAPVPMDVDVEDELLSLLGDEQRPNSAPQIPNAATSNLSAADSSDRTASESESKSLTVAKSTVSVNSKGGKPKSSSNGAVAPKLKHEEADLSVGSRPLSPSTSGALPPTSPGANSGGSGGPSARQSSLKLSEKEEKDRESMPPPSSTPIPRSSESAPAPSPVAVAAPQPKKRGKPGPKPKPRNPDGTIVGAPPPKPRGKPGPKPKPRDEFGNIIRTPTASTAATPASGSSATAHGTGATTSSRASTSATPAPPIPPPQVSRTASGSHGSARSRSTSVLPHTTGSVGPEGDNSAQGMKEEEKMQEEDDKLYCLCKTRYDEDKPMIACDSCDEWYHMKCVEIPEHKGDLVDQFFCSSCIEKNPSTNLKTTYKKRCLFGLNNLDPDSPKACHKPARTFSKYCSDECGVKNLRKKIDGFTKKGGKKEDLWETVKAATKREGLVRVIEPSPAMQVDEVGDMANLKPVVREVKPVKTKQQREIERLNELLAGIEKVRDELRRGMDILLWREKLLQLAGDRGESLRQCGWDQRLCFSDEDWADYGEGVLESYGEQGSPENFTGEGEWWCPGDQDCERHAGWQSLRAKDVDKEKEQKEQALFKLTSREREIRKLLDRIEEQDVGPLLGTAPRQASKEDAGAGAGAKGGGGNKLSNGHSASVKTKVNGDIVPPKKGKKRKAPS